MKSKYCNLLIYLLCWSGVVSFLVHISTMHRKYFYNFSSKNWPEASRPVIWQEREDMQNYQENLSLLHHTVQFQKISYRYLSPPTASTTNWHHSQLYPSQCKSKAALRNKQHLFITHICLQTIKPYYTFSLYNTLSKQLLIEVVNKAWTGVGYSTCWVIALHFIVQAVTEVCMDLGFAFPLPE